MAKKVYAVKKGLKTGIFSTWEECKKQVHGFPGAQYKSFPTMQEAEAYLGSSENLISQPEQDEDACIAYVDGSFDAAKNAYSYGCILLYQGSRREMSKAFLGTEDVSMRNVAGELEGAMAAMQYCEQNNIRNLHLYQGSRREMSKAFLGTEDVSMRNVAGELEGAMAAMQYCEQNNIRNLHLYYDYQGIESWATGEWKRNKPGTIRYKEFYDKLENVRVCFHKVKGHSGVELNEAVDQLAKAALGIR